jgi:hypothetical protein
MTLVLHILWRHVNGLQNIFRDSNTEFQIEKNDLSVAMHEVLWFMLVRFPTVLVEFSKSFFPIISYGIYEHLFHTYIINL